MAIPHPTKVYAIKECKISKLTVDVGGPTYSASVPLVGAKKLALGGSMKVVYLRGDNRLLDSDAIVDTITVAIDHAKLNLDALAVLWSTGVVDTGVTPNMLAAWANLSTDVLQYFKLEARAAAADMPASGAASDVLIQVWKCKLSGLPSLGLNEEDYQLTNIPLVAVPRLIDNAWFNVSIRETGVPLA
jgi:hypothetical protein